MQQVVTGASILSGLAGKHEREREKNETTTLDVYTDYFRPNRSSGDHFGVPMKTLKPRREQQFFMARCAEARELERRKAESRRACKRFAEDSDLYERGFCACGYHESEHKQRKAA